MVAAGTIRAAPALAVVKVVVDLGFDPVPILAEAGWSPAMLDDPDKSVPFAALGRLVAVAAARTGCDHFGLLVGQKAGTAAIGAIGFAARHTLDVRSALKLVVQHASHHDRGAVPIFTERNSVVTLGYRICHPTLPGADHITDGSLAIMFQLMKVLCGPQWQPLETSFAHRRPADVGPYNAVFSTSVRFDAGESAFSFPAHWLDCKVSGADPELRRVLLGPILSEEKAQERDLRDEVRRMLSGLIGRGAANQAAVARALGISGATLHRRLTERGTSFRDLLDEVRFELACRLLESTDLPVGQLAVMLDFSEASAFTRSFKRRLGCGPAAWRVAATAARRQANTEALPSGPVGRVSEYLG